MAGNDISPFGEELQAPAFIERKKARGASRLDLALAVTAVLGLLAIFAGLALQIPTLAIAGVIVVVLAFLVQAFRRSVLPNGEFGRWV